MQFKESNLIICGGYILCYRIFAALTTVFAKVGVTNVNSNLATAIRTVIILLVAWGIVLARGEAKNIAGISRHNLLFLVISGIATGLFWIFYFRISRLSRRLIFIDLEIKRLINAVLKPNKLISFVLVENSF